jgi:hypothetical protein
MPNCVTCGAYYRNTPFNQSNECDDCVDQISDLYEEPENELQTIREIVYPSGKTPIVRYD